MPLPENIFILFYWTAPEGGFFYMGSYYALGVGVLRLCLRGRGP